MFVSGGSIKSGEYDSYDEAQPENDAVTHDYAAEYAYDFGSDYRSDSGSEAVVKPADVMVAQDGASGKATETVIRYVTVTAGMFPSQLGFDANANAHRFLRASVGVSEPTKRSHHRHRGIASRSRAGLRSLRT